MFLIVINDPDQFSGGQSLRKILSILETIDFAQEMPPVLQLEVFNPALIEQVVTSCEKKNYLGLMFTDIQLLHRILMSELHTSQSSATGKRPHMIQVVICNQYILIFSIFCVSIYHLSCSVLGNVSLTQY